MFSREAFCRIRAVRKKAYEGQNLVFRGNNNSPPMEGREAVSYKEEEISKLIISKY
jgi:hypothetical protein